MRVALIGASGKVGRQVLQQLAFENTADLELVLIARNVDRVRGAWLDISAALPLRAASCRARLPALRRPRVEITSELATVRGSALVVVAAGLWPTLESSALFLGRDSSGRLAQSHVNSELMRRIAEQVGLHCPQALVLVVTNQSDLMSCVVRGLLPRERVLGMGGMLDSARFRALAGEALEVSSDLFSQTHVIGYHNDDMFVPCASLPRAIHAALATQLVDQTRGYGSKVSRLQKNDALPQLNSGSSVLPGYAVFQTIAAYTGQAPPLEESFNVALDAPTAAAYGALAELGLSVPIRISRERYELSPPIRVTQTERAHLHGAQQRLAQELHALDATL